jgi:hypothetical protein
MIGRAVDAGAAVTDIRDRGATVFARFHFNFWCSSIYSADCAVG